jgi:hypothetical protein
MNPHYVVISGHLLFLPSEVQIFPSAPCSQPSSIFLLPLIRETKIHTISDLEVKLKFSAI